VNQNARFESPCTWKGYGAEEVSAHESRTAWIRQHLPKEVRSILDVGCGNGLVTNRLLDLCPTVVGCDLAAEPIKQLACEAIRADATALPFPDRSFDLVMSLEMLEHLPDELRASALGEMARVSRRWSIIGLPSEEDLLAWTARCPECDTRFHVWGHQRSFDHWWFTSAFDQWGMRNVEVALCGDTFAKTPVPLAWIRTHLLGQWYCGEKTSPCPKCGYDGFPLEQKWNIFNKVFFHLERSINRISKRSALPYWQIGLFMKSDEPSSR
jgi:ubiquinone/menaquinone biosynthesis C-methylase UbiE